MVSAWFQDRLIRRLTRERDELNRLLTEARGAELAAMRAAVRSCLNLAYYSCCGDCRVGLRWEGEVYLVDFPAKSLGSFANAVGRWADDPQLPAFSWPVATAMVAETHRKLAVAMKHAGKT
jgi:hypothetical protein